MTTANPTPGEPAELGVLFDLAQLELAAGRLAEAAAAYRQILALQPDNADACYRLGNVLGVQGRLDEAADLYQRATALNPALFEAHSNLGSILRRQRKFERAIARYRQAIDLRPDLADLYNNLGNALSDQGKFDEAVAQYERALALRSDYAEALNNLGATLRGQGKLDDSAARFEQAIALRPDYVEAINNLGKIRSEQGRFDDAAACYERALAIKPDYAEAHYDRADLKTFRPGDPDLAALEALAADTDRLPPSKMLFIQFALGKALEDTGDYRRAFEHWLRGNALKRGEIKYNEAAHLRTFETIAEIFDSRRFERFAGVGNPSPLPIFVLGMPRSGSTLVEQILASHPRVHAAGELPNLDRIVRAVFDPTGRPLRYPQSIAALDAAGLRRLGDVYLASLPTLMVGKTRIVDKAPSNFSNVGLIRLILPGARIIHTMRNPVDTCVSCFATLFTRGQPFSYDLAELGRYYRGYHELMAHWRAVLPAGAMLDVSYEAVVDNLEEQARRLIDYCGLPWDDRCLRFHETRRPIATASSLQVRRPVYRGSLERWRRYEAYLQPLLAELGPCRR